MLALVMLMVASIAPVGVAHAEEADFKATLQAAERGDAAAQHNLGEMYRIGLGVTQDDAKARASYLKAAEQGFAKAQWVLGAMYASGIGGPKDYVQACKWSALSAQQRMKHDLKQAVEARDKVAKKMTPAQLAEAKRLVAEWKQRNAAQDGAANE